MDTKFPSWDLLSAEYGWWHQEVTKKNGASLNFQSWLLKQRTFANELFYDLKRLAVIKKWSKARFVRNAKELMDLKGYYFGEFEGSIYEEVMNGLDIQNMVYPWSVISQGGKTATVKKEEKGDLPSQMLTPSCFACGEDCSRPAWGSPISFAWDGARKSEKYFTCPKSGCVTAWDEWVRMSFLDKKEGGSSIQCPQCLSDICATCGVIKPTAAQKYWRQITAALDITAGEKSHGSKPFRRAAHQKGFTERKLTDVYAPLSVEDFFFTAATSPNKDGEKNTEEAGAELMSVPGTTMMFRKDQPKEEIDEAIEKERDMKQLFELRANSIATDSHGNENSNEPRGRQIARINFLPTHDSKPSDKWFSMRNRELYEESARFCARWFGDVDFPDDYQGSAWLEDYGEQFVQYTNLAAAEDWLVADWEVMMKQAKHRKWLVMGILSQIMEKKIHSELLFGASETENEELEKQDSMFLAADGYPRTKLRSQMINMFLGGATVPGHFWTTVDHLTNSTMAVLLPLTNLLCYFRTPERWTDTFEMYSQLHGLIAQVGYFAVCMARDETIFHVLSATPGARMDWGMEAQASYELYRECKEEAERLDNEWTTEQQAILKSARLEAALGAADAADGEAPSPEHYIADLERQFRIDRHHRLRGARVKYAVWPMVTRYRPENEGVTLPGIMDGNGSITSGRYDPRMSDAELEQTEGQRILDIGKCVVIYYQGLMYPRQAQPAAGPDGQTSSVAALERDGASLFDYRDEVRRAADEVQLTHGRRARFAVALGAYSVLVGYRAQVYQALRDNVPSSFTELVVLIKAYWSAFTWTLLLAGAMVLWFPRSRHMLFALAAAAIGLFLAMESSAWGVALATSLCRPFRGCPLV
ncbi:hypothetical protein PG993_009893 [Apiospora rasikravindrae]|uniref:Uncharacterized protein n=1 Tax=Apiospora rasikravindrae TaxID=990691 RepID=A0ABR1SKQ5_9PEZI